MNDTTRFKIPDVGSGKHDRHSFEWSIVGPWVKVVFPGAMHDGAADLEVECRLGADGYFDPNCKTQSWCETVGDQYEAWHSADTMSALLENIRPYFEERYAK